jgi:hypothetical protein
MHGLSKKANTLIEWTALLGAVIAGLTLITIFAKRPVRDKSLAVETKLMWDIWGSTPDWEQASNNSSGGKANDTISFSEIKKEESTSVTQVGRRTGETKVKVESTQSSDLKSLSLE